MVNANTFRLFVFLFVVRSAFAQGPNLIPVDALGLRIAAGFRVSLYADSDLANDIYAMTLDGQGNPVVTGQGYIRTLYDTDGDGRADSATLFAPTKTGGMGMCFDGTTLYFVGDGGLFRFSDQDGNGVADGPPEKLMALDFLEHGGHAIRKGPDGWWYLMAGNETRLTNEHANLTSTPIVHAEAGALLRLPPDGAHSEIIAEGFRNPYDFDFNVMGDLFTYDSDVESDYFLPWYTPTRLYQISYGGHHGWRLPGWQRSWNRPDYYSDTVDILARVGRGSPTGVLCYRHTQFPLRYRNGVFALDWTFGRIYFFQTAPAGSTYQAQPEVFIEPIGTQGFAPTDMAVTPDGSLLVSIGGRKTRGAVYRIEYAGERDAVLNASNWLAYAPSEIQAILIAPQPLEEWSRSYWMPAATRLGPEPFIGVANNNRVVPGMRMRAIEILTELHGGLPAQAAASLARANSGQVRARVAWSVGRVPPENYGQLLAGFSRDSDSAVRVAALNALLEHVGDLDPGLLLDAASSNLAHPEKRVRQAAARIAARLPDASWNTLWNLPTRTDVQARLTTILALLWREHPPNIHVPAIDAALSTLQYNQNPSLQLEAIRLVILGLGDWNLYHSSVEVYTGYEPGYPLTDQAPLVARIQKAVRPLVVTGSAAVDSEAARLLAMIADNSPETMQRLFSKISEHTTATSDFHYLTVLSRLTAPMGTNSFPRLANSILSLDRKLAGQEARNKQNWSLRLSEVVAQFVQKYPALVGSLLNNPNFASPGHLALVPSLGPDRQVPAARVFLQALSRRPNIVWTPQLIDVLSALPPQEIFPLFRTQWANPALKDDLALKLAAKPEPMDRDKFLEALESTRPEVVIAAAGALLNLPPDSSARAVLPIMRALYDLLDEPSEQSLRSLLVTALNHETGQAFNIQEQEIQVAEIKRAYQPVLLWFRQKFPTLVQSLERRDTDDGTNWDSILQSAIWDKGDATRGEAIFAQRGCQTCHASASPIGPELGGITHRLAPYDLFKAIIHPSRDIAAPYRTTTFRMRNGETYTGIVVFESPDGVIVQTGAASNVRLADSNILSRTPGKLSLMPAGLLNGLARTDLADLYAFLSRLQPQR